MIHYLKTLFRPDKTDASYSLAISDGADGSRLTHGHEKQYAYVLQSLTLWSEIAQDMFRCVCLRGFSPLAHRMMNTRGWVVCNDRLWTLAEEDLLDPAAPYTLKDTGQGLNRVQDCPRISKAMREIVHNVQLKAGGWVGSSVVHLGDNNVPNSLIFIDK